MKKVIYFFLFLSFLNSKSQSHSIGLGIGSSNFLVPNYEFYYRFGYKLIYAKLHFMFAPTNNEYSKSLTHVGAYAGIQSNPKNKAVFHGGLGARYLMPDSHPLYSTINSKNYIEVQTNLFVNSGFLFKLNRRHGISLDLFFGGIKIRQKIKSGNTTGTFIDTRFSLGYVFSFGETTKTTKN